MENSNPKSYPSLDALVRETLKFPEASKIIDESKEFLSEKPTKAEVDLLMKTFTDCYTYALILEHRKLKTSGDIFQLIHKLVWETIGVNDKVEESNE